MYKQTTTFWKIICSKDAREELITIRRAKNIPV